LERFLLSITGVFPNALDLNGLRIIVSRSSMQFYGHRVDEMQL